MFAVLYAGLPPALSSTLFDKADSAWATPDVDLDVRHGQCRAAGVVNDELDRAAAADDRRLEREITSDDQLAGGRARELERAAAVRSYPDRRRVRRRIELHGLARDIRQVGADALPC